VTHAHEVPFSSLLTREGFQDYYWPLPPQTSLRPLSRPFAIGSVRANPGGLVEGRLAS